MLWMIVPLVLVVAQLQFHYGYGGLEPGEATVLKLELRQPADTSTRPEAALTVPTGLEVETPATWIPSQGEVAWRIGARQPGDYRVEVSLNGNRYTKSVRVSDAIVRRSPIRVGSGILDQLVYPAEAPLPADSPLAAIHVDYPTRDVSIFGIGMAWWFVYLVLAIALAFALRNVLGVTI